MTGRRFRLPAPPPQTPAPDAFVMFPLAGLPAANPEQVSSQQALYQWAYEEAKAVVQPSLLERDLLGVWN